MSPLVKKRISEDGPGELGGEVLTGFGERSAYQRRSDVDAEHISNFLFRVVGRPPLGCKGSL